MNKDLRSDAMSGECDKCGEHCLNCKCGLQNILALLPNEKIELRELIKNVVSGLDSVAMQIYDKDCEEGSKEWHYNQGCAFSFSMCSNMFKTCLSLEDMKNDRRE
jgi:hypothetical protein